jgi:hypothetical protein
MGEVARLIANLLGLALDTTIDTVEGYFSFLWRVGLRFLVFVIFFGGLGLLLQNSVLFGLVVAIGGILGGLYLIVALPVILIITFTHKHLNNIWKFLYGAFNVVLFFFAIAAFIIRTDATQHYILLPILLLSGIIIISVSVARNDFITPEGMRKGAIPGFIIAAILLAIPTGLFFGVKAIMERNREKTQRLADELAAPEPIQISADCSLKCFSPTRPNVSTCWYSKDDQGEYLLFDGPGMDRATGDQYEPLTSTVAKKVIEKCKADQKKIQKEAQEMLAREKKAQAAMAAMIPTTTTTTTIPVEITTTSTTLPQAAAIVAPIITPPPAKEVSVIRLPAGMEVICRIEQSLSTKQNRRGDSFICIPDRNPIPFLEHNEQVFFKGVVASIDAPTSSSKAAINMRLDEILIDRVGFPFSTHISTARDKDEPMPKINFSHGVIKRNSYRHIESPVDLKARFVTDREILIER